jgi:hypothetical protein
MRKWAPSVNLDALRSVTTGKKRCVAHRCVKERHTVKFKTGHIQLGRCEVTRRRTNLVGSVVVLCYIVVEEANLCNRLAVRSSNFT